MRGQGDLASIDIFNRTNCEAFLVLKNDAARYYSAEATSYNFYLYNGAHIKHMRHTSIRLSENHLELIKAQGKSSTEVIKQAQDAYFGVRLHMSSSLKCSSMSTKSVGMKVSRYP